MEIVLVCIVALMISVVTYKKNLLTLAGAIVVFGMIITIDYFGKWEMVFMIVWAYFSLSILDKCFEQKIEKAVRGTHEKTGKRMATQVLVNGGAAVMSIIVYGFTKNSAFLFGYIVAIGEAYADSLASDIGVMSSKDPVDICTLKPIKNGLSGGISFLGTMVSFGGMIIYGMIAYFLIDMTLYQMLLIIILPMIGCIIDSIMGSRLQVKYICNNCKTITEKRNHCGESTLYYKGVKFIDNSVVNLFSNICTCILGILFLGGL